MSSEPAEVKAEVSIIIPTFNVENFVDEAISSCLQQTFSFIEVILVDDGSTDNTLGLLAQWARRDSRIVVKKQLNQGACSARNNGLRSATGRYVKFLDADDRLYKNAIELQLAVASEDKVVIGRYDRIDKSGSVTSSPIADTQNGAFMTTYAQASHGILISAPLYPRRLLERHGGFDENRVSSQEYELQLRLALAGVSFQYFDHLVFSQRIHQAKHRISNRIYPPQLIIDQSKRLLEKVERSGDPGIAALIQVREARFIWAKGRAALRVGRADYADILFRHARTLAGVRAINGKSVYRWMVRAFSPRITEYLSEKAKKILN